ncbi:hypothetical protein OROMI_014759 [Orobanche minor]
MSLHGSASRSLMSTARASTFRSSMPLSAPRRMRSHSIPSSRLNSRLFSFSNPRGYHLIKRAYPGKGALSSLLKSEVEKYQIKGCAGHVGFAQVFKSYLNSNPDDVVAHKIQKPPFPENEKSFGFAHKLYLDSDYSDGKEEDKNTCRR